MYAATAAVSAGMPGIDTRMPCIDTGMSSMTISVP